MFSHFGMCTALILVAENHRAAAVSGGTLEYFSTRMERRCYTKTCRQQKIQQKIQLKSTCVHEGVEELHCIITLPAILVSGHPL